MNNFDFKKYFLCNKYKMPQHIRTNMSGHIRNKSNQMKEKIMSYMPQSIRSYIMKQEMSGLYLGLIITGIFCLVFYIALVYLGLLSNPFQSLIAPKQNLQYFFF